MLRVLSHCGSAESLGLPADLRDRTEFLEVPQEGDLPSDATGDVLLSRRRADNIYDAATRVRWVHIMGTGVDNLDIDRLSRHSIVTNSKGAAGLPIAEWIMATLLAFEKQVPESWVRSSDGWGAREPLGTLHGRTLALVGLGSIGTETAKRALAFGMDVLALRRSGAPSPVDGVTVVRSVDELFPVADHLVLACPLTEATRHIVDATSLALVKPGVHLVNVARGDLIDQDALRPALDDRRVARASLDTASPEPPPSGHWLYHHPSVRLTPHVSWSYPGARAALAQVFFDNLRRYLDGADLENVLDPQLAY